MTNNTLPSQQDEDQTANSFPNTNVVIDSDEQQDVTMVEPDPPNEPEAESEGQPEPEAMDDTTELHTAARNIDLAHMRKILESGSKQSIDINAKTSENGHTPLWDLVSAAVEWDEIHEDAVTCLKLLVTHGADVNAQANNGATPLHRCAFSWCHDTSAQIAQVLLDHGANSNANKTIKPVEAESTPESDTQIVTTNHDHNKDEEDDGCECGAHIGKLLQSAYKSATGQTLDITPPSKTQEPLVTPLHLAAGRSANLPMLKLLLSHGASPSLGVNDPDAGTPLHLAVAAGSETKHLEIITVLLSELGPDASSILSIPNTKGYLPIHLACESYSSFADSKSHEIVTALLNAGSPVDVPLPDTHPHENRRGLTPLLLVAQNSKLPSDNQTQPNPPLETITHLISLGADPTTSPPLSQSALLFAVLSQNLGLVKCLSSLPQIDIASISASTEITKPLYAAAISAHPELIKFLVQEAHCPVDECDSEGYTALIHAAGYAKEKSKQAETIRMLVELGADIEAAIHDGRRPLHFAAFKGQANCVRELVRLGCDINAVDVNGWTALHFAGRYHHPEVVKILLDDEETGEIGQGKGKALIGKVVAGGPEPKMKDGEEIDIEGFNAADLAKTVRKGQETVDVLVERGEILGESTRDLKDEDLWEDKGGCTVM